MNQSTASLGIIKYICTFGLEMFLTTKEFEKVKIILKWKVIVNSNSITLPVQLHAVSLFVPDLWYLLLCQTSPMGIMYF